MKYGFIGCGNMGGAIAGALRNSTESILLSDPSDKAALLSQKIGCPLGTNQEAAEKCEYLFLAVKPQILQAVLTPLSAVLASARPVIVTMAAGVQITKIEQMIGTRLPIIRIMPNTPVSVGCGTILYCCNDLVTREKLDAFLEDMRPCGMLDSIPESLIDAASALSGCGPAYAYMFIDALADGAVACGVPRDKALRYAANTLIGASKMVLETGIHPGQLKDAVCSPGGSTIMGVKTLEDHNFRGAVIDCVHAAYVKTKELGK